MVVAAYAGKKVANYDDYLVSESVIGATTVVGESELPQYAAKAAEVRLLMPLSKMVKQ